MSNFYGTLVNERGKESTRAAHRSIRACAQSWNGSLIVELEGESPECSILLGKGSATSGRPLWAGRLSTLPLQFEKAQLFDRVLPALIAIADGNELSTDELHDIRAVTLRFAMDNLLQTERGLDEEITATT